MRNLKMLNSTKYLYKLTFIKYSYEPTPVIILGCIKRPCENPDAEVKTVSAYIVPNNNKPAYKNLKIRDYLFSVFRHFPHIMPLHLEKLLSLHKISCTRAS